MSENEKWSEDWAEKVSAYKELEKALEKLENLKGEKKRLMVKAVANYINAMIGEKKV